MGRGHSRLQRCVETRDSLAKQLSSHGARSLTSNTASSPDRPAFHPFYRLRLGEALLSPLHRRANGGLVSRVAEARCPQLTPQEGTGRSSRLRGLARTER